nr:MAG TPA: hypothetical protein [Caudoviricetes sp.]
MGTKRGSRFTTAALSAKTIPSLRKMNFANKIFMIYPKISFF